MWAPPDRIQQPHQTWKLWIASLNVGTMCGRTNEAEKTLARRQIDMCFVQVMCWRGTCTCSSARIISGKDCCCKFFWSVDSSGMVEVN